MQTFSPHGKLVGPIIPFFILQRSISFGAKIMYAMLCNYAANTDHCWPSQATLAEKLLCSVSSVKKYLKELVDAKLVCIRHKQYRSSVYYLLQPEKQQSTEHEAYADFHQSNSDGEEVKVGDQQPESGYLIKDSGFKEKNTPPLPPVRPELQKVTALPARSAVGGGVLCP